jgi:hypothetical protein
MRMELLEVTLTGLQRRNRAAFVSADDIPDGRSLQPGEKVVLRDEDGDYFAGTVIDDQEHDGSLRYLVHLGVRLPEEYAMLRLGRSRPAGPAHGAVAEEIQSVLDMLGDAREVTRGYAVPAQRPPA